MRIIDIFTNYNPYKMAGIYTVYHRSSEKDKWHWKNECPFCPVINSEAMVSTGTISLTELCPVCMELDSNLQKLNLNLKLKNHNK